MSCSDMIVVQGVKKDYKIYSHPKDMLIELVTRKPRHKTYSALKGVTFSVKKGEVVGILGRNGAGKSTLLKILTGVLEKTAGSVKIAGKVSAILELGTGFHPEYTGRENIRLGGLCLGMSELEIEEKTESIIEFSELRHVIDQPFKTYSSGMQSRLTFSVAISVEPEILIVDEALAAGDQFFVAKCIRKIEEICKAGATVLFVSHSLAMLERFCTRAIWLDQGAVKMEGHAFDVCKAYEIEGLKQEMSAGLPQGLGNESVGTREVSVSGLVIKDKVGSSVDVLAVGGSYTFVVEVDSKIYSHDISVGLLIYGEDGQVVFSATNYAFVDKEGRESNLKISIAPGTKKIFFEFSPMFLSAGTYWVSIGLAPNNKVNTWAEFYEYVPRRWKFSVVRNGLVQTTKVEHPVRIGVLN